MAFYLPMTVIVLLAYILLPQIIQFMGLTYVNVYVMIHEAIEICTKCINISLLDDRICNGVLNMLWVNRYGKLFRGG